MANINLLAKTLHRIESGQYWDQKNWRHCFAGHAVREAGYELTDDFWMDPTAPQGTRVLIKQRATELLGLDTSTAFFLFSGANSKDDLRRIVNEIIDKAVSDEVAGWIETPLPELASAI